MPLVTSPDIGPASLKQELHITEPEVDRGDMEGSEMTSGLGVDLEGLSGVPTQT